MATETQYNLFVERGKTYDWNGTTMTEFMIKSRNNVLLPGKGYRFFRNETTHKLANDFSFYHLGHGCLQQTQASFGYTATDVWHDTITSLLHRVRRYYREEDSYSTEMLNTLALTQELAEELFPVLNDTYIAEATLLRL